MMNSNAEFIQLPVAVRPGSLASRFFRGAPTQLRFAAPWMDGWIISVSFLYPAAVSLSTFPLLSALPSSLSLSRPLSLVGVVIKRVVLGLPVEVVGLNRVAARCGVWRLQ